MSFVESQGLRYFTFSSFPQEKLVQAVFTRIGGVSLEPWDSLNVGGTVGDERARVVENRLRSFHAVDRDPHSMFDVWQVHSADVVIANSPHNFSPPEYKADAIITDKPDVTLFMRFADCTPILFFDPVNNAVGIAHAGWMGTVKQVASATVDAMVAAYGTRPSNLIAGIGPSIGADHYQIGPDVTARVSEAFHEDANSLLVRREDGVYFDLWEANKLSLAKAGVKQIEISGICTACHPEDWYSHRAQKGKTGRFGAIIGLR
jgi:YfiH family protein